MSGSGPPDVIALTVDVLAPGARAATTEEVVRQADIIVLAVPTHRFRELPRDLFAGKILVDAMNYWEPVDGEDPELATAADGTSVVVQERFPSARVVKSLNQLGYHELDEHRRPKGAPDRIAIGAAGDDRAGCPRGDAARRPARVRPGGRRAAGKRSGPGARRLTVCRHLHGRRALEARRALRSSGALPADVPRALPRYHLVSHRAQVWVALWIVYIVWGSTYSGSSSPARRSRRCSAPVCASRSSA